MPPARAAWENGLRRILRPHVASVGKKTMSSVHHNCRGWRRAAKWTVAFAILLLSGWSKLMILWLLSRFSLSPPASPRNRPSCFPLPSNYFCNTLSPFPVRDKSLQRCYHALPKSLSLSTFWLRTSLLPREFNHLFIHSFIYSTFINTFIMCHLLVPSTWNALVNKTDTNPSPRVFYIVVPGNSNKHKIKIRKLIWQDTGAMVI